MHRGRLAFVAGFALASAACAALLGLDDVESGNTRMLGKVSRCGGPVTWLAAPVIEPNGLAAHGDYVYWTSNSATMGGVWRARK